MSSQVRAEGFCVRIVFFGLRAREARYPGEVREVLWEGLGVGQVGLRVDLLVEGIGQVGFAVAGDNAGI